MKGVIAVAGKSPTRAGIKEKMMKVVINVCYGGFGLSDEAYEELIKLGIPVRKYIEQNENNEGEVIFVRELTPQGADEMNDFYWEAKAENRKSFLGQRYWECWIDQKRTDPRLIKVVEKLGEKADGLCAGLKVVEIPNGIDWEIDEYDGSETIEEKHKS